MFRGMRRGLLADYWKRLAFRGQEQEEPAEQTEKEEPESGEGNRKGHAVGGWRGREALQKTNAEWPAVSHAVEVKMSG